MPAVCHCSRKQLICFCPINSIVAGHLAYGASRFGKVTSLSSLLSPIGVVLNTIRRVRHHDERSPSVKKVSHIIRFCRISAHQPMPTFQNKLTHRDTPSSSCRSRSRTPCRSLRIGSTHPRAIRRQFSSLAHATTQERHQRQLRPSLASLTRTLT